MRRIRSKLLLAMIAIVVVTLVLSALFTRRVTQEQVRRLIMTQQMDAGSSIAPIEAHFREKGSWDNAAEAVERTAREASRRVVLTSPNGQVIAVSGDLKKNEVRIEPDHRVVMNSQRGAGRLQMVIKVAPVAVHDAAGRMVGSVYFLPADQLPSRIELREMAVIDRRLILTFAVATLVAILLTVLISRRITRPIEMLTTAVDEMRRGKREQRVVVVRGDDEIARLAQSFNAMADSLGEQEELRRRMAGDVAHELRTPLTNLRCELEAIEDGLAVPDRARLRSMLEEVLHLGRLVDDLQDLAVAESGGLVLQKEPVDLAALVSYLVDRFRSKAAITFRGEETIVDGDRSRISQIVRNLIDNALQYAPGSPIEVAVKREGEKARIEVRDHGPGIPSAELERVFERFYRLDESRAAGTHRSAGLGLPIVKRLVALHGGSVRAENGAGGGAVFVVVLPLQR